MPLRRSPRQLLTALSVLLCACSGDPAPGAPSTPADTAAWTLADTPRARIGDDAAGPEYTLDRVYGGRVLPDGRIVVGNSGTGEVRFFDPRGAFLSSTGRKGGGPGEFRGINWIGVGRGDSIFVFDMNAQRFSVLEPGGSFVRSFQLRESAGPAWPVDVFPDGSIAVSVEEQPDPRRARGAVRTEIELLRVEPTGEVAGRMGRFPGAEWLSFQHPASYRTTQLPFGRSGHVAVSGQHLVYGSSESGRLQRLDGSGAPAGALELPIRPRALDEREISARVAEWTRDEGTREAIRTHYRGQDAAATAPAWSDLRADRQGNLWIQTFPSSGGAGSKWLVLSPDGEVLGSVLLPADARPLDIGPQGMLLRETDEDGVQSVSLRAVLR